MTTFHILDSYALDEANGQPLPGRTLYESDSDEEGGGKKKPYWRMRSHSEKGQPTTAPEPAIDRNALRMMVYLFGKTADGEPVRACVGGFQPFFFVRLPNGLRKTRADFERVLEETLRAKAGWLRKAVQLSYEDRKVLYGYTGGASFPFVRLTVPSISAFRALKRCFLTPETSQPSFTLYSELLEVYEANLDPMLRFFHLRNLKPCGWATTDAEVDEDDGILKVDWKDIHPCDAPPLAAAPFLMAAWDIECYSENGEFPLAKKGYDRLAKQIYATAKGADDAARLIQEAATDPDHPPEGLDGLRVRGKALDRKKLKDALESEVFQTGLEKLLTAREGLSVATKEDRILEIRKRLSGTLKQALPLAGDPVIQIGVVLVRGATVTEKHIFVLGTCSAVPGAVVHSYKGEREMILGWAAAMREWNADILMGYNVFGFDERYLWERAAELGITENDDLQALSRLCDKTKGVELETKMLSSSALGDNEMKIWSTYGRLQVDLFHYVKRSFSLPAYKLDYVCQHFMSGKLAGVDVAKEGLEEGQWFLKTKSTDDVVVGRYVTLIDETGDTVVEKLRILGVKPKEGLIVEAPDVEDLADVIASLPDAVKWAVVKDDVSPQDIFRLHKEGGAGGRAKIAAYCVQDCDLTVELYKKLDVFNNAMAMANACSVPVPYIFTRGQGIKIESLIFKECYARQQCVVVMPTQPRSFGAEEGGGGAAAAVPAAQEESYEGAIVLTPNPGFYFKSPVGVADFASLYPSTIISENISHDTILWAKDYDLEGRFVGYSYGGPDVEAKYGEAAAAWTKKDETSHLVPPGNCVAWTDRDGTSRSEPGNAVAWTDIEFDIWGNKEGDERKHPEKVKRGLRVCRYAQFPGDDKGTLPDIVQKLLAARKAKRKEAEKESDPFKKALLDAEQLAYKLTANSLYGQLGSSTFKIRLQHLAASVTAYGRKQILFAQAAIEKFYGPAAGRDDCSAEIVYGDTDSLFVNFNVRNPATGELLTGREAIVATQRLTEEAGKWVTRCLKPPHDFEYDKVFAPFIIFSKKRYVGNKYEESPDEYYQNSMGIATKRRDYAGIVKVIYGGAIRILLTEKDPIAAAEFVRTKLIDLAEGRVSRTQLTMTKSLRADYKSPTPPAHKVLAERIRARDPGNAPASGDRISFLYILPPAGQQASKLQGDRIETPTWIREKGLEIDVKFYMEHQLLNPISQLFALCVENLPGCVPPGGRTWATANPEDREYAAGEYLFREALTMCDRAAKKRAMGSMFGAAAVVEAPAAAGAPTTVRTRSAAAAAVASAAPAAPLKVQANLTSMFARTTLLNQLERETKAKKEAAAAPAAAQAPTPAPAKKSRKKIVIDV
jgi:DNA polymerase elongation subunit (family B)